MLRRQRGQPQLGDGGNAAWAQRNRTADPTREAQHQRDEKEQVDLAMHEHEQTTQAMQRAAQTARDTRQLASDVYGTLQDQGEQLERVNNDLKYMEEDGKEARNTLTDMRWMRRCCCCLTPFSCCCSCDPHKHRDATRRARSKQRRRDRKAAAKAAAAAREACHKPGGVAASGAALQKPQPATIRNKAAYGPQGHGLGGENADFVWRNTSEQNQHLDDAAAAADDMNRLAKGIEAEIQRQMPVIDATTDRMVEVTDGVRKVAKNAHDYRMGH